MVNLIDKITKNSLFKFLLGATAYFFFIIILQHTLGRSSCIAQILMIISVFALVGWTVVICIRKGTVTCSETLCPKVKSLKNAAIFIAYWVLIAVVLGADYHNIWLIYGLIAITVIIALTANIFNKKS